MKRERARARPEAEPSGPPAGVAECASGREAHTLVTFLSRTGGAPARFRGAPPFPAAARSTMSATRALARRRVTALVLDMSSTVAKGIHYELTRRADCLVRLSPAPAPSWTTREAHGLGLARRPLGPCTQRSNSAPGGARAHLLLPLLLLELVDAHERREQEVDEELRRELLRLVRAMIRG